MVGYKIEDLIELFRASDSLSTDGYKQICDSLTGVKYVKRDHLYRSGVWRKNEVRSFVSDWSPETKIIVLGHSDTPTRCHDVLLLRAAGVRTVIGTNCTPIFGVSQCLPLGLTNFCDDSQLHRILGLTTPFIQVLEDGGNDSKSDNSILMSFNRNTSEKYRGPVFSLFDGKPNVTTFSLDYTIDGRLEYLKSIMNHDFVLCPRGNGRDTHRLWETLYLGSIPIVKRGELPSNLLMNFPVWTVNKWSDALDPKARVAAKEEILANDWDVNRLRQTFWNSIISSHVK
jgi:hypothetical protein